MTRHIVDHRTKAKDGTRTRAFLKIEREMSPSEASQTLQRSPRGESRGRLRQFLRIERGRSA